MADKSATTASPSNTPGSPRAPKSQGRIPNDALISLVAFLCCLVFLILLIANAEKLSRFGLSQQVYYLTLVLMGLVAAGFLFGVLKSSATYVGKFWGGTLRLGGPAVVFFLVLKLGHGYAPKVTS